MKRFSLVFGIAFMLLAPAAQAAQDVVNTRHNLSVSGPGTIKSGTITQVCVFCHTPHNALPDAQLWNHLPTAETNYIMYDSSTLKTTVLPADQPTGKSRLCLACHDGTVALGALQNPPNDVTNDLASTLMTGRGDLTTDLSNDHPISFAYDTTLFETPGAELLDPLASPADGLPLEGNQLQCTTCHDPHEKDLAPFLRLTTADGTLCITCHDKTGWADSTHQTSTAAVAATDLDNRRPEWVQPTVAGNACLSCHTPHNAANAERLLAKNEEDTCYACHDGTPASDIQADFAKVGGHHPVELYAGVHDATKVEKPVGPPAMSLHVECMDCHNPHTVTSGVTPMPMISFNPLTPSDPNHTTPPAANALIQGVTGVNVAGDEIPDVNNQYELCFKCHGPGTSSCGADRCGAPGLRGMRRVSEFYNITDNVNPNTPGLLSYHPIVQNNSANDNAVASIDCGPAGGKGQTAWPACVAPVAPLDSVNTIIYCTDCHNSDTSAAAGGTGPNGPHGSTWEGMLAMQYTFDTDVANNTTLYELCFKCHDQGVLYSPASFSKHAAHLEARGASCIICHDPHGSRNARLMNFLTHSSDGAGGLVVECKGGVGSCDPAYPVPTWVDGPGITGECYLNCHNSNHAKTY